MNKNKGVRETRQAIVLPRRATESGGEPRHAAAIALWRKSPRLGTAPVCAALLLAALALPAFGQSSVGFVGGITRNSSSGEPEGKVQIVAHNLSRNTDRTTVSDADGLFTLTDLEPGPYEVAAMKDGFEKSLTHVDVAARKVARLDLPLHNVVDLRRPTAKSDNPPLTDRERELLQRLDLLEQRLAAMEAAKGADATTAAAKATPAAQPLTQEAALTPNAALPPAAPVPPAPAPAPVPVPAPDSQAAAAAPAAPAAAAQTPAPVDLITPFADYDWTWLNGNSRQHEYPLDTKYFSPEFRADTFYVEDFNQPIDHSMGGSSEIFRNNEVQLGGSLHRRRFSRRANARQGPAVVWNVRGHDGAQ